MFSSALWDSNYLWRKMMLLRRCTWSGEYILCTWFTFLSPLGRTWILWNVAFNVSAKTKYLAYVSQRYEIQQWNEYKIMISQILLYASSGSPYFQDWFSYCKSKFLVSHWCVEFKSVCFSLCLTKAKYLLILWLSCLFLCTYISQKREGICPPKNKYQQLHRSLIHCKPKLEI